MTKKSANPYWIAQDILSRRDHSESEVRAKLAKKDLGQQVIEETIAWLKDKHLIDDKRYARGYVESILRTKAVGRKWVYSKLKQRGVDEQVITAVLDELLSPEVEGEQLKKAALAWKRSHARHADDPQRLRRFLGSRGFTDYLISEYIF